MTIDEKIDADLHEMTKEIHPGANKGCLYLIIMLVIGSIIVYLTTMT